MKRPASASVAKRPASVSGATSSHEQLEEPSGSVLLQQDAEHEEEETMVIDAATGGYSHIKLGPGELPPPNQDQLGPDTAESWAHPSEPVIISSQGD